MLRNLWTASYRRRLQFDETNQRNETVIVMKLIISFEEKMFHGHWTVNTLYRHSHSIIHLFEDCDQRCLNSHTHVFDISRVCVMSSCLFTNVGAFWRAFRYLLSPLGPDCFDRFQLLSNSFCFPGLVRHSQHDLIVIIGQIFFRAVLFLIWGLFDGAIPRSSRWIRSLLK